MSGKTISDFVFLKKNFELKIAQKLISFKHLNIRDVV